LAAILEKFIVLKPMIWNKRKYYPPRINESTGELEYDIIALSTVHAEMWNHAGTIVNEEKFRKGQLIHPDDFRY